ncbi:NUDIX hydrolase [Virgibacillus oceani]
MDAVFKTDEGVFNYRVAGIWVQKGYVLLHKNVNDNHWTLPGGRVGIMEESNMALQREFQEELGIDVKVERFLWSSENFFNYDGKNFHEIGLYYLVTSITDYKFNQEAFFGMEGNRLIYKWIPISRLNEVSLYPGFLKKGIKELPRHSQHIVVEDVASLNHRTL